jgi:hypothetical protein
MSQAETLATTLLEDAFTLLVARLAEHHAPSPQVWTLDVIVDAAADSHWRFVMGRSVEVIVLPGRKSASDVSCGALPLPVATLTLSRAMLAWILDDPTGFDVRNPASLALGGVRIEGSGRHAVYWLQLLKRPSPAQLASLARARALAPVSLHSVPQVLAKEKTSGQLFDAILDALEGSTPLHLQGVIDWPEIAWTLDDWRVREGATALPIRSAHGGYQCVAEFISGFNDASGTPSTNGGADAPYISGCLLPPAWDTRFKMPILPAALLGLAQLWLGQQRTQALVALLHCDLRNSLLAQVMGRKRVRLYGPAQEHLLYAFDAFNSFRPCRVDVAAPDLNRFPRFAQARGVEVVLAPGDLLIVPTGWFHCVWALDDVLSISRFLGDETIQCLRAQR